MALEAKTGTGVLASYGPRNTSGVFGADTNHNTLIKKVVWDFTYNDLPDGGADQLGLSYVIPANSTIVSAKLIVDTAFTSTSGLTDLTVGLYRATDGTTAIDASGLITAVNADQTAIGTVGSVITGTGALVGKLSSATYDAVLVVAPSTADLTGGEGRIIVEYILNS